MTTTTPETRAVVESRNKNGTLTLDGKPFACQATSVAITPPARAAGNKADSEVLCGLPLADDAGDNAAWRLVIKAVQDFDNAAGLINLLWDKAGDTVPFTWQASTESPTYAGDVHLWYPDTIGGDVAKRLFAQIELDLTGKPSRTFPA